MTDSPLTPAARSAYTATVLPLTDALRSQALRLSGGRESEADDLVQDTLVRALRGWNTYNAERCTPRAWLFTVLRNTFRNRYAAQNSRSRREQGAHADGVLNVCAVPGPDARDTGRMVREAVAALPADYAAVVTMVDLEGASYREAAEALGCPAGTVMSRLSRARKRLAAALSEAA
jgi:RNA polymerase sigma-70 factor (ECF subfamily)